MRYFMGIDLGSTTTKAVLVDETGAVVGQGLTNTRSSYEVASAVAKAEALAEAELSRLADAAAEVGGGQLALAARRAWRVELATQRLSELEKRTLALTDASEVKRAFSQMKAEAAALFGPLAEDRSRFFRDVVSSRFCQQMEAASGQGSVSYEEAMGAFDRALVEVDNSERTAELLPTLERALAAGLLEARWADPLRKASRALERAPVRVSAQVGTGYGRQRLPFPKDQIRSEILCHGLGAHALFPNTRTVLDIGGQDTKAIQVDERGNVTGFQMNDRCAAGCGRYLGYIADEMNLAIHELGPLALKASRAVRISSTCTVFAGVELRERLSLGERRENILLGLHRAIVMRAIGLLARSGGVKDEFTFTGGVAKNPAAVRELVGLAERHWGVRRLNVHPDSIYTGALGAALFARKETAA